MVCWNDGLEEISLRLLITCGGFFSISLSKRIVLVKKREGIIGLTESLGPRQKMEFEDGIRETRKQEFWRGLDQIVHEQFTYHCFRGLGTRFRICQKIKYVRKKIVKSG